MNKKAIQWILLIALALQLPVTILLGNLRQTAFDTDFYSGEFEKYNPDAENSTQTTKDLIYYLQRKDADSSYLKPFAEEEISHLADVKALMQKFFLLKNISIVLLFILTLALFYVNKNTALKNLSISVIIGGALTILLILLLYILALNFEPSFIKFHELFFAGNWQFSKEHLLIKLFPSQFFVDITNRIILNSLVNASILILAGTGVYYLQKKIRHNYKR